MDNTNFITAVVLSIGILVGFHYLYEKPQMERVQSQIALQKQAEEVKAQNKNEAVDVPLRERKDVLAATSRVKIETPELRGSINLKGGRLDDLELVKYREDLKSDSPEIVLLSPTGSLEPHRSYYAAFGWLAAAGVEVPTDETVWTTQDKTLSVKQPVRLAWDNGKGLLFERVISIDENFLFTVVDRVKNTGDQTVTLYPYGLISRHGHPAVMDSFVMHEGPIGVLEGTLREVKYNDLAEEKKIAVESQGGWLGITDKYWLVSLLPSQDEKLTATFSFQPGKDPTRIEDGLYQIDYRAMPVSLASGANSEHTTRLFAGAKRVSLLDQYEKQLGLPLFDRAIDFGWYYYLTKPFLYLLDELNSLLGNMGLAIIVFTIALKILTLPLSLKSNRSMAKIKTLQPELVKLQERYKDDKQKLSIETMELYRREKVNPMSGCFPILIQIPIFFALYKVLYVGIEMRHAPLFGWIKDMSAPDPTNVLSLFGLIDWSFLPHVGVWPLLMGISMFAQQKMAPQPADKTQANMFLLMPVMFTFMMGSVAVGLIFYWTVSNILGIAQQWYITRKVAGHKK